MKPNFYQSALPKYLNIDYRLMVNELEQKKYGYKEPSVVKVREYSSNDDFKKRSLITVPGKYRRLVPNVKVYI
jgi:hypothetical protein